MSEDRAGHERRTVDDHLVSVLNGVLDCVYQAKQASWAASTSPLGQELRELVSFLIDQSGRFMEAEERIDGRSAAVSSPSSHQRGNLVAEAGGDIRSAVSVLAAQLDALAKDARTRATSISQAPEASMLAALADGLEVRAAALRDC
jgi:uncharacterized protein YukE